MSRTTRPPLARPFTPGVPATNPPGRGRRVRRRHLLPVVGAAVAGTLAVALALGYWLGTRGGTATPLPAAGPAAVGGGDQDTPGRVAPSATRGGSSTEPQRVWQWLDRLKATPTPAPPAGLEIDLTHSIKSGRLRVWIDDDVVLDEPLQGFVKKQILLYKSRRGTLERAIDVEPGEHSVRVRIDDKGDSWNERVTASFESGETRRLSVELGGFLRKRLKVEWEQDEPSPPAQAPS